jgi:hypothetical protein
MLCFPALNSGAQDCKVMMDSLKGKYEGDCHNGLAAGKGTATGINSYTGQFKNGYPDGKGKYTWSNGNWYDGNWKKGLYEGEGRLHLAPTAGADSSDFTGYWAKGKFLGRYEKPYIAQAMTNNISNVSVNRGKNKNEIVITVKTITGGANSLTTIVVPKQKMTDIQLMSGSFLSRMDDENSSPISNKYTLRDINYPIRFSCYFGAERLDLEFFEKGNWNVLVMLDK